MTLTKDQWYAHPSFQQELAQLLQHPTLRTALEVVKDEGLRSTLFTTTLDLRDYFALHGAKKDGYREAIINLEDLSKPMPVKMPEQKAWTSPDNGVDSDKTSAP